MIIIALPNTNSTTTNNNNDIVIKCRCWDSMMTPSYTPKSTAISCMEDDETMQLFMDCSITPDPQTTPILLGINTT